MPRPIIGITVDTHDKPDQYESPMAYSTAVEKAGGLPLLLPYRSDLSLIPQFADLLEGMLFSGGNDLDPALYGETYHPKAVPIDPARQRFELALLAEIEKRRVPALGICLGSQLMNVYRGGSLHQFIPEGGLTPAIEHRKLGEVAPRHEVNLKPQSLVAQAAGKTCLDANSSHKQSVKSVGRGLRIIGTAPDGVIEGIEDPTLPLFLGVQWHPERLADEADHLSLFKLLVDKAAVSRNR
ncbi:MAG TPA: gamma-glutamyl-gamma-aminobutyrate hydrolase family protein [Tepidisphaeraceae bacterium]|jgi:putative glutamine amidotransferase|nr:gamma-glutamyl-gamma-aminobutyrate hydrolase family protein [Tepidisphaeraceae bacterium]